MRRDRDLERKIDLSTTVYGAVREGQYQIAVLPWGATEPHNYHLPYMTDCILSQAIALDAADLAWKRGVHCMVLPPVPYGSQNPGQRELPFCIHARYETQRAILGDIVASLYLQGLRTLVIINGHGGNNFKNMIRDFAVDYPDFLIVAGEWFKAAKAADFFEVVGDHADEVETSVMMHYHPEWVRLEEAGDGSSKGWALPSLEKGFAWLPRNWQKVSTDTGIGDPSKATAEKGRRFATACAEAWANLLMDLAENKELYRE